MSSSAENNFSKKSRHRDQVLGMKMASRNILNALFEENSKIKFLKVRGASQSS